MYGLGGGHRAYNVRAPTQVNGLPVIVHVPQRRPDQSLTEFASPNLHGRPAQPRPRAVRAGPVAAEPPHDQRGPALRLAARIRAAASSVAGGRARAGPLVPGHHDVPNWKDLNPQVRHRVGSEGRREDRDQVRHQPLRGVDHDGHGATSSIRSARATQQHDADVERPDLPGRRPAPRQLPARLRPRALNDGQRRVRRDGQPELRHVRAR